jgi:hypothetical protein
MEIVKYHPALFPALQRMVLGLGGEIPLQHQAFVDYYYASSPWCTLFLLNDDEGDVIGSIGFEQMPFRYGSEQLTVGIGHNFLVVHQGVGHGLALFRKWTETCDYCLAFGGTAVAHRIYRKNGWQYFPGVVVYNLNEILTAYPGEKKWHVLAKKVLRKLPQPSFKTRLKMFPKHGFTGLSVSEESHYSQDMATLASAFRFRFAPSVEYLSWRYATNLPFVRYRIFRILHASRKTIGYVVFNQHHRNIAVAHCDGIDPGALAHGVLLGLEKITREYASPPEIRLASSHPEMQQLYRRFGFRASTPDRPFAIGSLNRPINIAKDTSTWMVNFDWGDNGLRMPFLDRNGGEMVDSIGM